MTSDPLQVQNVVGNDTGFPLLWFLGAIGIGGVGLAYAIYSAARGVINVGRPPRDIYRSADPGAFWRNVALIGCFGAGFFLVGLIGLLLHLFGS